MTKAPSIKEALEKLHRLACDLHGWADEADSKGERRAILSVASRVKAISADFAALATLSPPAGERREAIARIIDPEAFQNWERAEGNWRKDEARTACWPALEKAGIILASGLVQDEAGIRADEVLRRAIDTAYCHAMTVPCFPDNKTVERIINHAIAGKPAEAIIEKRTRSARDGGEG